MRNREERAKAFIATMLTVSFCMFAGAAGYHQYLKTQETKEPLATSQVSQDQIIPIGKEKERGHEREAGAQPQDHEQMHGT